MIDADALRRAKRDEETAALCIADAMSLLWGVPVDQWPAATRDRVGDLVTEFERARDARRAIADLDTPG